MQTAHDTVAGLQSHIDQLQQELLLAKKMVNSLCVRKGEAPLYVDVDALPASGSVGVLRSDQFYGVALSTAMREYLSYRRARNMGPATVNDIYTALCDGGFKFDSTDPENRKRNLRISLTKTSAVFHRLPDGSHYGLKEWYPNAKSDEESATPRKKSARRDKKRKSKLVRTAPGGGNGGKIRTAEDNGQGPPATAPPQDLKSAARLAMLTLTGDFTKQAVVNWIAERYPDLDAPGKKSTVYTAVTRLKDDLDIETVKEGGGKDAAVFRRKDDSAKRSSAD
jgi:hypothetical protein